MAKVDDKKYAEFMAKRKKEKKQTSTQKSLADIRARAEKVKEGYVSMAQQRAVWATRKDGGKGHPDNKKKNKKEDVNEIARSMTPMRDKFGKSKAEKEREHQGQAKRMMSPLQKMRQDKEKADRDRDGRLKAGIAAMKKAGNAKAKAELGERVLTQKDKERAFAKAAKTAKPKSQVSLKKAPFKIPSEKDMKNEGKARDRLVKMVDKASGRTMADREKDAKAATASRKAAEKDHSDFKKKMSEKFDFKVSVDGFPEMFMSGNSPGEVKTALRKLVKQPSMIKSVDRVTKAEKKKEFRKKVREEKSAGGVDYGSDESIKIMKKKTPGQKDEGIRDFMSGVANKAKSALSFMYKNDGRSRPNTNAKSTSGRQNAKASPSLAQKINFGGKYGG